MSPQTGSENAANWCPDRRGLGLDLSQQAVCSICGPLGVSYTRPLFIFILSPQGRAGDGPEDGVRPHAAPRRVLLPHRAQELRALPVLHRQQPPPHKLEEEAGMQGMGSVTVRVLDVLLFIFCISVSTSTSWTGVAAAPMTLSRRTGASWIARGECRMRRQVQHSSVCCRSRQIFFARKFEPIVHHSIVNSVQVTLLDISVIWCVCHLFRNGAPTPQ